MQLLITNPDMLHQSILPVHPTFAALLSNLAYVVVDEGHAYRCLEHGALPLAAEGAMTLQALVTCVLS